MLWGKETVFTSHNWFAFNGGYLLFPWAYYWWSFLSLEGRRRIMENRLFILEKSWNFFLKVKWEPWKKWDWHINSSFSILTKVWSEWSNKVNQPHHSARTTRKKRTWWRKLTHVTFRNRRRAGWGESEKKHRELRFTRSQRDGSCWKRGKVVRGGWYKRKKRKFR